MNPTPKQSRRNFLRGLEAVAVTAAAVVSMASATPIVPVNPDDELLALCAEWHVSYLSGHDKNISEEEMDARTIIADEIM